MCHATGIPCLRPWNKALSKVALDKTNSGSSLKPQPITEHVGVCDKKPLDHITEESLGLTSATWVTNTSATDGESWFRCSSFDPPGNKHMSNQPLDMFAGHSSRCLPSAGRSLPQADFLPPGLLQCPV